MNKKYKIIALSLGLIGLIGAGLVTTEANVYAETVAPTKYRPLMQKLIGHFNLDKTVVDKIIQDYRTNKQEENRKLLEDKLTKQVKEGKITEAQKNEILAKTAEWIKSRQTIRTLPIEQRKSEVLELRQEIKSWKQTNNLTGVNLGMGRIMGMHKNHGNFNRDNK